MLNNEIFNIGNEIKEVESMMERFSELNSSGCLSGDDKLSYLVPNLLTLSKMLLDCDQSDLDIDAYGEPVFTERVFKVNRYIPNYIVERNHLNYTVIGGLFAILPCWLLPAGKVQQSFKTRNKIVTDPTKYGLPDESKVLYSTLTQLTEEVYVAIAKAPSEIISDYILTKRHVDYIYTV